MMKLNGIAHYYNYVPTSKEERARRKNLGICVICGSNSVKENLFRCEKCSLITNRNVKKRRNSLIAAGLCCWCGKNYLHTKRFCLSCYAKHKESGKRTRQKLKAEIFLGYGGAFCACCGESELAFLSIDHINDNGAEHRRVIGQSRLYYWLL